MAGNTSNPHTIDHQLHAFFVPCDVAFLNPEPPE
jgi:hypothetical protein